jgi:hypothetical protein
MSTLELTHVIEFADKTEEVTFYADVHYEDNLNHNDMHQEYPVIDGDVYWDYHIYTDAENNEIRKEVARLQIDKKILN